MTSEFGAHTQLEKIEMLDVADLVVLNKFEKRVLKMRLGPFESKLSAIAICLKWMILPSP